MGSVLCDSLHAFYEPMSGGNSSDGQKTASRIEDSGTSSTRAMEGGLHQSLPRTRKVLIVFFQYLKFLRVMMENWCIQQD